MPNAYSGIVSAYSVGGEGPVDISAALAEFYVNRTPVTARLLDTSQPVGNTSFTMLVSGARPTSVGTVTIADDTATSVTVSDSSAVMVGDVLECESERMTVTSITSSTVIVVSRGSESTTAAAHSSKALTLLYNSRTGSEIDQEGVRAVRSSITNYVQTIQHPVQVGGRANALKNVALAMAGGQRVMAQGVSPTIQTLADLTTYEADMNFMLDLERAVLYGKGEAAASTTTRSKMKGIHKIISEGAAGNVTTSPTNASAYKPSDFIRDTVQKCAAGGGNCDLMIMSNEFRAAFFSWGLNLQALPVGETVFGTSVETFRCAEFSSRIIFHPLLSTYSCFALDSSQLKLRHLRKPFIQPRGVRGDAIEADIIGDLSVHLDNPTYHAHLSGVTAFAAQS